MVIPVMLVEALEEAIDDEAPKAAEPEDELGQKTASEPKADEKEGRKKARDVAPPPTEASPDPTEDEASGKPAKADRPLRPEPAPIESEAQGEASFRTQDPAEADHKGPGVGADFEQTPPSSTKETSARHPLADDGEETGEPGLTRYLAEVRERLAGHAPRAVPGASDCHVTFRLSRAGALVTSGVSQSSGSPRYDRRCLKAISQAAPFPQAPDAALEEDLVFSIAIRR